MGYHIYAWLDDGNPNLEIRDADTQSVCLRWAYSRNHKDSKGELASHDRAEVHKLFREFILLTCKQEARNCRVFGTLDSVPLKA